MGATAGIREREKELRRERCERRENLVIVDGNTEGTGPKQDI